MNNIKNIINDYLKNFPIGKIDLDTLKNNIKMIPNEKDKCKAKIAYRMIKSLININIGKSSWMDFCSNLRNYILFFNEKVEVSEYIKDKIEGKLLIFKLNLNNNTVDVINDKYPSWFLYNNELNDMYNFEDRRGDFKSVGDPLLYNITGYINYKSLSQKIAIKTVMEMNGGETLLVGLATGGGKSLISQIPSINNIKMGKMTIVIVPTIALAIDQEKSTNKFLKKSEFKAKAYHSGLTSQEKKDILCKIKLGKIPILYVSPEAAINKVLYEAILDAAMNDIVEYLVIDEAHIVLDWGESFRQEFQFLSILRKNILMKSNKLKTILLSATLSDEATETLKNLFSEEDKFFEIRGDALRNELMIWIEKSNNFNERKNKFLDIIDLLPRPIIVYVNKKEDAKLWKNLIIEKGYKSIREFTGDTPSNEREKIIQEWDNDDIDFIIATSAFGMGVDKDNVRVVIHNCIPESINRYYQEIGRCGRDGHPSVCILNCYYDEDIKDVYNLTKGKIAKTDNIIARWTAMIKNPIDVNGDKLLIDIYNSKPVHLENEKTGRLNADWNKYVVLFMMRIGFIELLDLDINMINNQFNILIKIKNFDLYNDKYLLIKEVEKYRTIERENLDYEIDSIKNMIIDCDDECINYRISEIYKETDYICGGCPSCRKKNNEKYEPDEFIKLINMDNILSQGSSLNGKIKVYLGYNKEILLNIKEKNSYAEAIYKVIKSGVRNLIIPDTMKDYYLEKIDYFSNIKKDICNIYTYEEIYNNSIEYILHDTTAIIYYDRVNDMYNLSKNLILNNLTKIIHIAKEDTYIESQSKKLEDLIEGKTINIDLI